MRDLLVNVGRYPCGSLNVEVSSSGLAIADRRHVPHMPQHLSIITITPDLPDGAAPYKFAPWDTVRGFVATNVFMPEFSRLAHRSSFERRHSIRRATSTVCSVLSHRRSSSDRPTSDDRPGLPMCMLVSCTSEGPCMKTWQHILQLPQLTSGSYMARSTHIWKPLIRAWRVR